MTPEPSSGLKVLLMTDLVGSVTRQQRLGNEAYAELKAQHDALVLGVVEESPSGEILEQTGDGYFIIFANVKDALRAALMIQSRIARGDWASERPQVRIGVHLGEVTPTVDQATGQPRYAGITVSLTARIMDLATGDQILLSGPVYENGESAVRAHPAEEGLPSPALRWQKHGRFEFNGIRERVRIYEVGGEGIAPFTKPAGGAKARRVKTSPTLPIWIGCAVLIAILAVAAVFLSRGSHSVDTRSPEAVAPPTAPTTDANATPTIAVLPFANLDEETSSSFSAGVHDDILTSLGRLAQLRVISRTSVLGYGKTQKNMRQIGAELGATHLVEGSVRRSGNRVRVTVQLIEAATDHHLWAENFDRELKDVFAIQSEIAKRIASSLLARLSPSETAQLDQAPTDNLEAYDAYNRAREQWRSGARGEEDYDEIVAELEAATLLDPAFAEAWSLLSQVNSNRIFLADEPDNAHLDAARFALRQAQRTGPGSTAAYLAEAYYHYWGHRDFDTALQPLVKARLQSPNDVEIMKAEAWILRRKGRFTDSLQLLERAADLDPNDQALIANLVNFHELLGDFERAEAYRARLRPLSPEEEDPAIWIAFRRVFRDPSPANRDAFEDLLRKYPLEQRLANDGEGARPAWFALALGEPQLGLDVFHETWEAMGRPDEPAIELMGGLMFYSYQLGEDTLALTFAERVLKILEKLPPTQFERAFVLQFVQGLALEILGRPVDWKARATAAGDLVETSGDALWQLDSFDERLLLWALADLEKAVEFYFEFVNDPENGDQLPSLAWGLGQFMPEFFAHPRLQAVLAQRPEWKDIVAHYSAVFRPLP